MYFTVYTLLGSGGGGRVGRKQYLTIEVFQYMFLLYYFIKAMGWGGGSRCVYSRHLYMWGWAGGGGGLDVVDQNNFVNLFCMKKYFQYMII